MKVTGQFAQWLKMRISVLKDSGSLTGQVKSVTVSPTARHRRVVFWELCCPGAKPRGWTPPLVRNTASIIKTCCFFDFVFLPCNVQA